MKLTGYEMQQLQFMADVFRQDRERKLRRIRRNLEHLTKEYEILPSDYVERNAILSPQEEMEELKQEKAEAVIIKKKLDIMKSKAIKDGEWN